VYANGKISSDRTIPGMGSGGIKENGRGDKFNYYISDIL
jgi:hypothetical protein